jgi:hypothetical protein
MKEWTAIDFQTFDLNAIPPKYSFPVKYWWWSPPVRQIHWLLDQQRIDDAVVYFIHECGASFPEEMRFLQSRPDPYGRIARLRAEGRVRLFRETIKRKKDAWYGTNELILGPNSGIDSILRDVLFLNEAPNPGYAFQPGDEERSGWCQG